MDDYDALQQVMDAMEVYRQNDERYGGLPAVTPEEADALFAKEAYLNEVDPTGDMRTRPSYGYGQSGPVEPWIGVNNLGLDYGMGIPMPELAEDPILPMDYWEQLYAQYYPLMGESFVRDPEADRRGREWENLKNQLQRASTPPVGAIMPNGMPYTGEGSRWEDYPFGYPPGTEQVNDWRYSRSTNQFEIIPGGTGDPGVRSAPGQGIVSPGIWGTPPDDYAGYKIPTVPLNQYPNNQQYAAWQQFRWYMDQLERQRRGG